MIFIGLILVCRSGCSYWSLSQLMCLFPTDKMAEQVSKILSTVTMDKNIANSLIEKAEHIPPSTLKTLLLNIAQCSKSNHAAELRSEDPSWFRGKIILFNLANLIVFIPSRFSVRNSIWLSSNFSKLHCIVKATRKNVCVAIT